MSGCINNALAFLTESFHSARSYSTINVYRSMLSSKIKIGPDMGDYDIGKHPQMLKLMLGIYNSRLPVPKYTRTWIQR